MPETIIKSFRYDFTEAEAHDLALELADNNKQVKAIAEERKKANKKFTKDANDLKAIVDELSVKVSDGYEMREVACEVEYNKPSQGQKTVSRTDTGETFTEPMTEEDWTLFSQA